MDCARCSADQVDGGRYCWQCGSDLREELHAGPSRRESYVVHPGEPVLSFNVTSSVMPLAAGSSPQTYRFAMLAGLTVPALAAVFGFLPFAFTAAAVLIPILYVVYMFDVNEWEDQPLPVLGATIVATALLGGVFTYLWRSVLLGPGISLGRSGSIDGRTLLVYCLLVPIGTMLICQLGPAWLASRPKFDDLLDGLTFGFTAGAVFAAVETLILNSPLILGGSNRIADPDGSFWVSVILISGFVKPVVYGTAAGLVTAAWSGVGQGYDGFRKPFWKTLVLAVLAIATFQTGVFLLGRLDGAVGATLSLLWGLAVGAGLILRIRSVLHRALLEAALEAAAEDSTPPSAVQTIGFCGECEMPLVHRANFCTACGTSVRAVAKSVRRSNSEVPEPDLVGGVR